jgi:hypothetical protein
MSFDHTSNESHNRLRLGEKGGVTGPKGLRHGDVGFLGHPLLRVNSDRGILCAEEICGGNTAIGFVGDRRCKRPNRSINRSSAARSRSNSLTLQTLFSAIYYNTVPALEADHGRKILLG